MDSFGNLLISNRGCGRVDHVAPDGRLLASIGEGTLSSPAGLAYIPLWDSLLVVDSSNQSVFQFDSNGEFLGVFATEAALESPWGIGVKGGGVQGLPFPHPENGVPGIILDEVEEVAVTCSKGLAIYDAYGTFLNYIPQFAVLSFVMHDTRVSLAPSLALSVSRDGDSVLVRTEHVSARVLFQVSSMLGLTQWQTITASPTNALTLDAKAGQAVFVRAVEVGENQALSIIAFESETLRGEPGMTTLLRRQLAGGVPPC